MKLEGTFPVLCTPFDASGAIAQSDFDALIDFVLSCGADGCVYPGVASEVDTLSADERSSMVLHLGERLRGRAPFIVGASGPTADAVLANIETGARAGAAVAMVMAPHAIGADTDGQTAFFTKIGITSALPIMLQNAPVPIGAGLSPEAVAQIARAVPAIAYVKEETMPCGQKLSRIAAGAGDALLGVFGGAGGRYITDELARGSLGTMPAAELTDLHVRLVNAWRAGDEAEARRLFMISLPVLNFQAVFRMGMTKATLMRRNVLRSSGVRGVGPRMDQQDLAELDALLSQLAPELQAFPLRLFATAE